MLRRGLLDGTQRLHGQLRDTVQQGQQDGYGGDQVEDTAWKGGRWGERGIEKLLKKKKGGKSTLGDKGPSPRPESPLEPSDGEPILPETPEHPAPADGSEHMQIKTREAVTARERNVVPSESGRSEPPSAVGSERQQVKIQESAVRGAHGEIQPASHGEAEYPRIRTRDVGNTTAGTPSDSRASPLFSALLPGGRLLRAGMSRPLPEVKLSIRLSLAQRGRSRLLRPAQSQLAAQPVMGLKLRSTAPSGC